MLSDMRVIYPVPPLLALIRTLPDTISNNYSNPSPNFVRAKTWLGIAIYAMIGNICKLMG